MNAQTPIKLGPIDIFDPSSYPTRRDEEWHYSDLKRVLSEVPSRPVEPLKVIHSNKFDDDGFFSIGVLVADYTDLQALADQSLGRFEIRHGTGDEDVTVSQKEAFLHVQDGQTLIILEKYEGELASVAHTTLHFSLGEGASLTRIAILDEPSKTVSIRRSTVETAPNSTFKQYVISTGAKFQRFETHVNHVGQGAEVELNGAYLLKDKTHFDYTTRITHAGRDGVTRQLIKGLVKDQATGVFQGRILVERGADGTDARMHHQALMLNDGAHVRAKPELEIYADDVQCAHGNTIGALDEAALFFCQSRGMPEAVARAMLTQAFVLPVAEMIEDEALREKVLTFLTEKAEVFHGL